MTRPTDVLAASGAATAFAAVGLYVVVVRSQDSDPAWWVVLVLVTGASGAAYASRRSARARLPVLAVSTALLGLLGLAALLSIGLLILLAAGLCLVSLLISLTADRPGDVPDREQPIQE
jgi:hypothetical protein